ncbi:MAG: 5-formyltetrahydrofolate cyclo-ligase [Polyangiaceae bacterium]|nr:5-formyltetrahydrofolate cyclo-ligase [Polyangiaceae bacterium]
MDDLETSLRLTAKRELRKRLMGLRKTLTEEGAAARSAAIVARVIASDSFARAACVAVFHPMLRRREIDLRALVAEARARGKRVAYPWIGDGAAPPCFRAVDDDASLVETPIGALEPASDAPAATPDLILVPALAVDLDGWRLGYGGGYYDRLLSSHPDAESIAVVYELQILAEIPALPHDRRVGRIASEARLVAAGEVARPAAPAETTEPAEPGVVRVRRPG